MNMNQQWILQDVEYISNIHIVGNLGFGQELHPPPTNHNAQLLCIAIAENKSVSYTDYRIVGNFGDVLNLVIWRIW